MLESWRLSSRLLAIAVALGLVAATLLVRADIVSRREAFQNDARLAHRLLSQRAAQHDAILDTLVLLDPGTPGDHPSARLPALYPQVQQVWQRAAEMAWQDPALADAEIRSRLSSRPELAKLDAAQGSYDLVLAGSPASYALRVELDRWVPWSDWPFDREGPVSAELTQGDVRLPLHAGTEATGWRGGVTPGFVFAQSLDTPSQPFELRLQRATGPADWPWPRLAALVVLLALATWAVAVLQRQRLRRQRAEQLLRLTRTARLNSLGELAAGMAHELNQPLTAVIASTQAARRLLNDDPLQLATLNEALTHASAQARRAADVVARLRRLVERPQGTVAAQPVRLGDAVRGALELLQPELRRLTLRPQIDDGGVTVAADPVALEQILHNLLSNALQAMADVPAAERSLKVSIRAQGGRGLLRLRDGGPGLAPEVMAHLFEPFNTTRPDGLGLGLSLCESLATAMGGTLNAQNLTPTGAEFVLDLPLDGPR